MKAKRRLILMAVIALSVSTPALAQRPDWSQPGDYYRPGNTIVQQPTPRQQYLSRHGDYYAPGRRIVRQPTPRQLYLFQHGDYYAPGRY